MLPRNRKTISWLVAISLSMILIFGIAGNVFAVDFRGGDTVTIGKNEVINDDLVVSGATVVIDGEIKGDLVVAAAKVIVNGKVDGSLMMAGQTLELNGQVGGTVYSAGAALTVGSQATVARSLFFGGYSYTAASGSVITRDNLIGGYQAILKGEVKRNLFASVGALELNGTIGGNVNANVAEPSTTAAPQYWAGWSGVELPPSINPGLRIGPEAKIRGKLMYSSPVEQTSAINTKPEGGVVYSTPQPASSSVTVASTPRNTTLEWVWARLREFVSLLFIGGLALWLLPALFSRVGERTQVQPWLAGGWGVFVAIMGYVGALLALSVLIMVVAGLGALTLAGLAVSTFGVGFSGLGFAFTLFSLLVAYGSKLVVVYPLTHLLLEKNLPQWNQHRVVPLTLGVLLFVLLRSIPYFGLLLSLIVTLIGLGAMWLVFRERFTKAVAPKLVPVPA